MRLHNALRELAGAGADGQSDLLGCGRSGQAQIVTIGEALAGGRPHGRASERSADDTRPLGIRWAERFLPRIEKGEVAGYDLSSPLSGPAVARLCTARRPRHFHQAVHRMARRNEIYRLSSRVGSIRSSRQFQAECGHRDWPFFYVSCWEMYQAIDAIRRRKDPVVALREQIEIQ